MASDPNDLQQELRESRERLLTAQRVARVGFLDWDLRTNLIVLSEEACRLTGYWPDGPVVTPEFVANTVHPDDLAYVREQLDLAVQGVKPYDIVHRHVRPDGSILWVHAQAELTRDEHGVATRLLGTMVDITEQKRVEEALRESELRYKKRNEEFERVTDAFVAMDRNWVYTQVNAKAGELFHRRPEDLLGKHIWTEFPEGVGQPFHLAYERAMATQQPTQIEAYYAPWDRWFENSIYPSPDGISIYFHDITPRKRAEQERERFAEQLRELSAHIEAAREEERTGIAREIHDRLGQSLTALKMDVHWILRRARAPEGLAQGPLLEKVTDLLGMCDELIDEVRRISSELRPGILDHVGLGAALSWNAEAVAKRTQLACAVESQIGERPLDRALTTAVFRVFQELLTNVVRHASATRVDVRLAEVDGALVLEVRDDGRGIKQEEIDDPRSLGLLGVRERVRHFGGTVTFARGNERGTVVTVRVPLDVTLPRETPKTAP